MRSNHYGFGGTFEGWLSNRRQFLLFFRCQSFGSAKKEEKTARGPVKRRANELLFQCEFIYLQRLSSRLYAMLKRPLHSASFLCRYTMADCWVGNHTFIQMLHIHTTTDGHRTLKGVGSCVVSSDRLTLATL